MFAAAAAAAGYYNAGFDLRLVTQRSNDLSLHVPAA
jgi:hypothetical protein